jgi:3'-phosphoadenosine 5'-phosphosulfate sulfotransferase (PAPS reductase)/FAD synthetase
MKQVIAWWSGGITSAVACHLALKLFEDVRIVFIDTRNEDDDTYRFKDDCEKWYGKEIEVITNNDYENIEEVWIRHKSLNVGGRKI